ncbi:MAG: AAA family ATPase, partial [Planctomycetales bacterium]
MYLNHWSLQDAPFRQPRGVRWFYHGPVQEEVLARLQFLVEHRHPLGILTGAAGSGKSLMMDVFAARLHQDSREHLQINLQGADQQELWWRLSVALGLNPSMRESPFRLWRRICDRLAQLRLLKQDVLALMDDADEATPDAVEGLTRLLALNRRQEGRLTIVLGCRQENLVRLAPRLLQEAELKIEVEPLSLSETAEYLNACLAHAGGQDCLFSNAATAHLHVLSGGYPRRINHLAELALVAAASQGRACVDAETVEGVCGELDRAEPRRAAA